MERVKNLGKALIYFWQAILIFQDNLRNDQGIIQDIQLALKLLPIYVSAILLNLDLSYFALAVA